MRIGLVLLLPALVHRPASAAVSVRYSETAATALSARARSAIEQIAAQAEREARVLLPDLPGDVALLIDAGTSVIPETGETGAAPGPGAVTWTVDVTREEGVEAIARSHLRRGSPSWTR